MGDYNKEEVVRGREEEPGERDETKGGEEGKKRRKRGGRKEG